jgi:hypothetical protein
MRSDRAEREADFMKDARPDPAAMSGLACSSVPG